MRLRDWVIGGAIALALASPVDARTLRWADQHDALTLDPHGQNERITNTVLQQIYEPLIRRRADLVKEPGLATDWKAITPTTWEFKIRANVKFHDGGAFSADDVVFSLNRARQPTSDYQPPLAGIRDIKAIDALTVQIVTDSPNPVLPDQLTGIFIMSKAWAETNNVARPQDFRNKEETFAVINANGTGPFILQAREVGIKTVLVKNAAWWGLAQDPHNVDELVIVPIKEPAARANALLAGEIDVVTNLAAADAARVQQAAGFKLQQAAQVRTIFLGFDVASAELKYSNVKGRNPFADQRVRQAVYQAIDVNAIKAKAMQGFAQPAGLLIAPGVIGYTAELDKRPPFDGGAAKKLMADAGYGNGFEVTLDCPIERYENDEAICRALAAMLEPIGIKVTLDLRARGHYFPKLQKRDTSFYLMGWSVPNLDSHYVLSSLLQSSDGRNGNWNFTGYSNPSLDRLISELAGEMELGKRNKLIGDAWKTVNAEMIYLPLHHQMIIWAMSDKLTLPITATDIAQFRWARMR